MNDEQTLPVYLLFSRDIFCLQAALAVCVPINAIVKGLAKSPTKFSDEAQCLEGRLWALFRFVKKRIMGIGTCLFWHYRQPELEGDAALPFFFKCQYVVIEL